MVKRTLSWHKKKTKVDFNKFIRLRDADEFGMIICITCGARVHYKEANAGHFIHGLDFIEDNQHGQCVTCNKWNSGKLDKYTLYMIDRYGRERVDELERLSGEPHKYKIFELQEMRKLYKQKVKEME